MAVRTKTKLDFETSSKADLQQDGGVESNLCFRQDQSLKTKSVELEGVPCPKAGPGGVCFSEETLSNSASDNLEVESGVESASGGDVCDWLSFGQYDIDESSIELDLTTEQAQETLRYFSKLYMSYFK